MNQLLSHFSVYGRRELDVAEALEATIYYAVVDMRAERKQGRVPAHCDRISVRVPGEVENGTFVEFREEGMGEWAAYVMNREDDERARARVYFG